MNENDTQILCVWQNNICFNIHLVDCLGGAVPSIGPSVASLQVAILDLGKIG